MAAANQPYLSSSLYVGDLLPEVSEALLFEIFNQVGPVASIRVCRDSTTRRSLGYAYVNFHSAVDAENALEQLNYTSIKGKPCRIMWSHRDPSIRKSNKGNVFIKNLDKSIDNNALHTTFSVFGNILSCKVATDDTGSSKGFGFVHFETEEAAKQAIEKANGKLVEGKKLFVGLFQPRKDRGGANSNYTNLFVKNLPMEWSDEKFVETFKEFGEITSAVVMKDAEGKSKGFGFVNFKDHAEAAKAEKEMNERAVTSGEDETKTLYVARAQKRSERERELREKFENLKMERLNKYQGVNLYVKNLGDDVDDDVLRQEFASFGTITSAKVMRDKKGASRGFGFVCFSTSDEATKAVTEMNGRKLRNKPLYVALAQRREVRQAQLAAQRQTNPRAGMAGNPMYQAGAPLMYAQPNGMQPQPYAAYPGMMANRRWNGAPPAGGYPMPGYVPQNGAAQRVAFNQNARNRDSPMQAPAAQQQAIPQMTPPEQLTPAILAAASPEHRKQMLGEKLYPLVAREQPELAGKITGMFLEIDNTELLNLLESEDALRAKISEAVQVLQVHAAQQQEAAKKEATAE